jgi:tetratricopeptide (TPR) repeat protein
LLTLLLLFRLFADPSRAETLVQRGLVALQHGQLVEARAAFEQASHMDPKNPYAWASLAETYLRLKEPQQAALAAQAAEKTGSENPIVCHALAMYYSESGQFARAAQFETKYAKSAWEAAKPDPQTAFHYAQVLLEQEQFTQAAEVVSSALDAHPADAQLTLALGVARYGQRRFEDSVVAFLKVIHIDPAIEQPYLFLGRMLDQAGPHLGEITTLYEIWASQNPQNAKAQLLLAKARLAANSHDERAEGLQRHSIALNPNDWEAHYELGVLLANKHQYQSSAAELTRSIELDSKQPMPHYHLARVYDRLGQPERAKAEREVHQRLTAPTPR